MNIVQPGRSFRKTEAPISLKSLSNAPKSDTSTQSRNAFLSLQSHCPLEQLKGLYTVRRYPKSLAPLLLKTLKTCLTDTDQGSPKEILARIYAFSLLCLLRVKEAMPLIQKIIQLPRHDLYQLFGNDCEMPISSLIVFLAEGDDEFYLPLLNDPQADHWAHGIVTRAYCSLGSQGYKTYEEITETFKRFFEIALQSGVPTNLTEVFLQLAMTGFLEFRGEIQEAIRQNRVAPEIVKMEQHYDEMIQLRNVMNASLKCSQQCQDCSECIFSGIKDFEDGLIKSHRWAFDEINTIDEDAENFDELFDRRETMWETYIAGAQRSARDGFIHSPSRRNSKTILGSLKADEPCHMSAYLCHNHNLMKTRSLRPADSVHGASKDTPTVLLYRDWQRYIVETRDGESFAIKGMLNLNPDSHFTSLGTFVVYPLGSNRLPLSEGFKIRFDYDYQTERMDRFCSNGSEPPFSLEFVMSTIREELQKGHAEALDSTRARIKNLSFSLKGLIDEHLFRYSDLVNIGDEMNLVLDDSIWTVMELYCVNKICLDSGAYLLFRKVSKTNSIGWEDVAEFLYDSPLSWKILHLYRPHIDKPDAKKFIKAWNEHKPTWLTEQEIRLRSQQVKRLAEEHREKWSKKSSAQKKR